MELAVEENKLLKGFRQFQGDPLSPYLFAIAAEVLVIAVRHNKEIKGTRIGKKDTKLLQYVDHTTAVLPEINLARALFK